MPNLICIDRHSCHHWNNSLLWYYLCSFFPKVWKKVIRSLIFIVQSQCKMILVHPVWSNCDTSSIIKDIHFFFKIIWSLEWFRIDYYKRNQLNHKKDWEALKCQLLSITDMLFKTWLCVALFYLSMLPFLESIHLLYFVVQLWQSHA